MLNFLWMALREVGVNRGVSRCCSGGAILASYLCPVWLEGEGHEPFRASVLAPFAGHLGGESRGSVAEGLYGDSLVSVRR